MVAFCASVVIAPICVASSSGSPTTIFCIFAATSASNSSATRRSTIRRLDETQHCPVLKLIPKAAASAASSRLASSNTTMGFLPPSSSPSFLKLLSALAWTTERPTRVEPVNDSMSISACSVIACPMVLPGPVTTL